MKQKIERLRSLMADAPETPWVWWNGCSWWRIGQAERRDPITVLEPYVASDGHPNISAKPGVMELIVEAVNALPDLLSHIDALEARVGDQVKQHISLHNLAEEYLSRAEAAERALEEAVEVLRQIAAHQRGGVVVQGEPSGDRDDMIGLARAFLTKRGEK